jgi:hypothetical protein
VIVTRPHLHAVTNPAEDLADDIIGRLYQHADARERYAAVNLIADRIQQVRAVTAKQLELELGGLGAAAEALGVSRQAITELYAKTETPGPRADRDRAQRPTHLYGRWLAAVHAAADLAGAEDAYASVGRTAMQTTTTFPAVMRRAEQWLKEAKRRGVPRIDIEAHRSELALTELSIVQWVTENQRHLTIAEQSDAILGYHAARKAPS